MVLELLGVAGVLTPVFGLMALGVAARREQFPGDNFWAPAERLTYFVLFPALIAGTLATADLGSTPWARLAVGIGLAILLATLLVGLLQRIAPVEGPRFTSLHQGAVRMNTYVGLAIAARLAGDQGLAYAAVAIAIIVPLVNVLCVAMLAAFGERGEEKPRVVRRVVTNPLILACLIGVSLNVTGIGKPPVLGDLADLLGRAALPLGLLAVGASLRWEAIRLFHWPEALATTLKLALLPATTFLLLSLLGLSGVPLTIGVLFTALPTAPSSYLLARQLGGDAPAMAAIIACQTVVSAITLPIVLACCH